ncbi:MAG: T6SS effector amidase Tae4 family protein [Fibrobacteria bacterium]
MPPPVTRTPLHTRPKKPVKGKVVTNTKKGSVHVVPVTPILFSDLWSHYPSKGIEHLDPKTKTDLYKNHCAINVCEALVKSGVAMASFKGGKCSHCPGGKSLHSLGASQTAEWLKSKPFPGCGPTETLSGKSFKTQLGTKTGIIFFKDYWQRDGEEKSGARTGDHIDLWNAGTLAGSGAVGSFFRVTLGFSWDGWLSDLELATEVLFWNIK